MNTHLFICRVAGGAGTMESLDRYTAQHNISCGPDTATCRTTSINTNRAWDLDANFFPAQWNRILFLQFSLLNFKNINGFWVLLGDNFYKSQDQDKVQDQGLHSICTFHPPPPLCCFKIFDVKSAQSLLIATFCINTICYQKCTVSSNISIMGGW